MNIHGQKDLVGQVGGDDGSNDEKNIEEMLIRWRGEQWDEILPYVAMG